MRWYRLLWTFFASIFGLSGLRVIRIPAGPVSESLYTEITAFERRIATSDVGGRPTICDQGRDYGLFWRAIGRGSAFVATDASRRVIGVGASAGLRLRMPNGRTRRATYLGHLRVLPECRFGPALASLSSRLIASVAINGMTAFGIVSERSGFHPHRISTGFGLPAFRVVGRLRLVYFSCAEGNARALGSVRQASEREVRQAYLAHTRGMIVSPGGRPQVRSGRPPRWIMTHDGCACACLEDCDRVRRWIQPDGSYLSVTNLSFFGWSEVRSAAAIVCAGLAMGAEAGVHQLRIIVDESLVDALVAEVGVEPCVLHAWNICGASVWGIPRAAWSLHATEL